MSKYLDAVVKKWEPILKEGSQIKSKKILKATALMLENQERHMTGGGRVDEATAWQVAPGGASSVGGSMDPNSAGYAGNAEFHKIAVPMVRRTFPELIAHEIVGVQPMTGPVGLAFALRFIADQTYMDSTGAYGTKKELGYNNLDPKYSGTTITSAGDDPANGRYAMKKEWGEQLGSRYVADYASGGTSGELDYPGTFGGLGIGSGRGIKEISMTVEKAQVEAKTRKLRSRWSLEVAQDLKAMHGLDLEEEMMDILAYEITAEIDRELVNVIRTAAGTNSASTTWSYSAADGRWEAEKYRNLYNLIIRKANRIAIDTRRGAGNYVIAHPDMCAMLEATSAFTIAPVNTDVNTAVTGVARLGSLDGRMTVYRDTFATSTDAVIGYKGASEYDTGIIYLPYVQLMASKAVFEDSFNPTVGLMSRYSILPNIFGSKYYYIRIATDSLTWTK